MAGELGKRIVSINSTLPKSSIPINNKPISHMAEKIQTFFGARHSAVTWMRFITARIILIRDLKSR